MLQVLNDERERGSNAGTGIGIGADTGVSEETGYSVAFIMDPWTHPTSDEAKAQSVDIPVRIYDYFFRPMGAWFARHPHA